METSILLARILGLFGMITTFAIISKYDYYLKMEKHAAENPANLYLSGFVILLIGSTLVALHPTWTQDWRVIITIIGYLTLLKGLIRLIFPQKVEKLLEAKQTNRNFLVGEITIFLLSLYLLYMGFTA